jgi:hypothetical protein
VVHSIIFKEALIQEIEDGLAEVKAEEVLVEKIEDQ